MSRTTPKANGKPKSAAAKTAKPNPQEVVADAREDYEFARSQARRQLYHTARHWIADISYIVSALLDDVSRVSHDDAVATELFSEVLEMEDVREIYSALESLERQLGKIRTRGAGTMDLPDLAGLTRELSGELSEAQRKLTVAEQLVEVAARRAGGAQ